MRSWTSVAFIGSLLIALAWTGPTASIAVASDDANDAAIAEVPQSARRRAVVAAVPNGIRPVVVSVPGVREEVDRDDNVERVLLFAPGGPIVLEATVFLDGEPFRRKREALIDEMLALADTDGDGKPTWAELASNRRFGLAAYLGAGGGGFNVNPGQGAAWRTIVGRYDRNGDGAPDRYEIRLLLAQAGGGSDFTVAADSLAPRQPNLVALLDQDGDGSLSAEEIAAAPQRLKSRDANDDDLVDSAELGGAGMAGYAVREDGRVVRGGAVQHGWSLSPGGNEALLMQALVEHYGRDGKLTSASFPFVPKLFDQLDLDDDGAVAAKELAGLATIPPHVSVAIHLGKGKDVEAGVRVASAAAPFETPAVSKGSAETALSAPGLTLRLRVGAEAPLPDYGPSSNAMIRQFDTDGNAYLEKKELESSPNKAFVLSQFDRWDADGDGKVYAEEIKADYDRQLAPRKSQVTMTVGSDGPSLFALLDASGEGRLSLREMRTAPERLRTLDKDGDGRLSRSEIPVEMRANVSIGGFGGYRGRVVAAAGQAGMAAVGGATAAGTVPKWFVHMDRNGDGDVSEREFLGTPEKFRELDANGDGFVEPKEAAKAR